LLVLAAHAVTLLFAKSPRAVLTHWAAMVVGAGVLVSPLALVSALQAGAVSWITPPGLWDLKVLSKDYFGATLPAIAIVVCCAAIALLWKRYPGIDRYPGLPDRIPGPSADQAASAPWWRPGRVTLPSVALPLLVLPAGLLLLESVVTKPLYVDRYVLYGEAGAALLAGAGMYRIGQWLRVAASR